MTNRSLLEFIGVSNPDLLLIAMAGKKPATTVPDDASFRPLVKAYQTLAKMRIAKGLKVTGSLDGSTASIMEYVSGQDWRTKTWGALLWDLFYAHKGTLEPMGPPETPQVSLEGFLTSKSFPWVMVAVGAGALYFFTRK